MGEGGLLFFWGEPNRTTVFGQRGGCALKETHPNQLPSNCCFGSVLWIGALEVN